MTGKRRRERRYGRTVTARVPDHLAERLDALADQELVSLGIVVRRCLEAGIDLIERGGDGARRSAMETARAWWSDLDNAQRNEWQKRLPGRKGRDLIAEAWRQANGL